MITSTKPSSEWIYKFYRELEKNGVENHALLIIQNGETVFEEYAYPYSRDIPHTLFSVTKSIVSTAAGFAITEGLFSLDSEVLPFFSEFEYCESDEWKNLTVRSLLTMQSNKKFSFLQDMTGDYVEMFMKAPFRADKGFLYSNNDAHMVAALVQKVSGMNLVDYLIPRLFEPLGIEPPEWETNQRGECIGGTGAYMKLCDLAKISYCYGNGGRYNGKQIIPEWWAKEATSKQVNLEGRENEDGYGYFFWLQDGVFSMNGMYGQQISYFPQYDAVIADFNCVVKDDSNNYLMKKLLPKAFEGESTPEWDKKLEDYLKKRKEKALPVACNEKFNVPSGKTFYITPLSDKISNLMFPAGLIPRSVTSSFAQRPKTNLNKVSFCLSDDVFTVKWFEEEDEVVINCGLDGMPRFSECRIKGYYFKIWAYAYTQNGKVKAVVKPINSLATCYITFIFSENEVKIQLLGTPDFKEFIANNAGESSFVSNSGVLKPIIMKGLNYALSTVDRPMKFKAK